MENQKLEDRKLVFVSSPYRGVSYHQSQANLEAAKECCRAVYEMGYAPVAPHLHNPQFMSDEDRWMECGKSLLLKCDEMFVFRDNGISEGMNCEIKIAYCNRIPIRFVKLDRSTGNVLDCPIEDFKEYANTHFSPLDEAKRSVMRKLSLKQIVTAILTMDGGMRDYPSVFLKKLSDEISMLCGEGDDVIVPGKVAERLIILASDNMHTNEAIDLIGKMSDRNVSSVTVESSDRKSEPPNIKRGKCCGTCSETINYRHRGEFVAKCAKFKTSVSMFDVCDDHSMDNTVER